MKQVLFGAWILSLGLAGCITEEKQSTAASSLEQELMLARAEGIPTTAEEIRKTIPTAPEEENAAQFYRELERHHARRPNFNKLAWHVTWDPAPEAMTEAMEYLNTRQGILALGEQIGTRPLFWMDRPWEEGQAILFRELAPARTLAHTLLLRGDVAAREGRHQDAIADAKIVLKITSHLRQENILISSNVAEAISHMLATRLMHWAYRYQNEPAYSALLNELIETWPEPDLRARSRDVLYNWLLVMDQVQTKDGRAAIGLLEDERAPLDDHAERLFNQPIEAGKVRLVKGFRQYWRALKELDQPSGQAAMREMLGGMMSVPTAVKVVEPLSDYDEFDFVRSHQAFKALHRAYLDAAAKGFPRELDTAPFVSPLDGKPVRYFSDGKTLKINAGLSVDRERKIEIPGAKPE